MTDEVSSVVNKFRPSRMLITPSVGLPFIAADGDVETQHIYEYRVVL